MTVTIRDKGTWWSRRGWAYISLAVSLAEIVIIAGAIILVQTSQLKSTPGVVRMADGVWLIGSLASLGLAGAALIFDSDRRIAVRAMVVAIIVTVICGIPLTVSA